MSAEFWSGIRKNPAPFSKEDLTDFENIEEDMTVKAVYTMNPSVEKNTEETSKPTALPTGDGARVFLLI